MNSLTPVVLKEASRPLDSDFLIPPCTANLSKIALIDFIKDFVALLNQPKSCQEDEIFESFNNQLAQFRMAIDSCSGMMNTKLATPVFLTLVIVNDLVNEEGTLNLDHIPLILRYLKSPQFLKGEKSPPCIKRIREILERLMVPDSGLVETINKINSVNADLPSRCRLMITSALNIPFNSEITVAMLKKVVLKSLLDYPRQIETNDCQGQWPQMSFNQFRPEYTLHDYIDLVLTGAMYRLYNGKIATMTFPPYMACSTIRNNVTIDKSGIINNEKLPSELRITIWEALPIQSALNQMNLPYDNEELNSSVLNCLFNNTDEQTIQVNAMQIIAAYAKVSAEGSLEKYEELMRVGCYGFAALRNATVQRALVSATLFACEYTAGPSPINWITKVVSTAFEEYKAQLLPSSGWVSYAKSWFVSPDYSQVDSINELVTQKMKEITTTQYEQHQVWNGTGDFGQNIIYQKSSEDAANALGKRICTQEGFQELVQQAISDAKIVIEKESNQQPVKTIALDILNKMNSYAQTEEFVDSCCENFGSHYGTPPVKPYATSQNVPWRFFEEPLGRSSTWPLLDQEPDPAIHINIQGSKEGIDNVVSWWMEQVANIDNLALDPEENPMTYNGTVFASWFVHSFNWMTYHKTLRTLREMMITTECSWQDAFQQLVVQPGDQVADSPLVDGNDLLNSLDERLKQVLDSSEEVFEAIPNEDSQNIPKMTYNSYLNSLNKTIAKKISEKGGLVGEWSKDIREGKEMSIYSTSQLIIKYLNSLVNSEGNPVISEVINGLVSGVVIKHLSPENYELLSKSALHIANTNWANTENTVEWPRDIHLCVIENTATKSLAIGMITDNNKGLMVLPLTTTIGAFLLNLKTVPGQVELKKEMAQT